MSSENSAMGNTKSKPIRDKGGKNPIVKVVFKFAALYILLDILLIGLCSATGGNIFHLILWVYISNFVIVPFIAIIYAVFQFIRENYRVSLAVFVIAVIFLSTFVYATFIEPKDLKIKRHQIFTDKFTGEVTIAHITDFQSAKVGAYENWVIETINEIDPDIIFHTGDFVQPYNSEDRIGEIKKLAGLFKKLNPKYGTYNVMGNIETVSDIKVFDQISGTNTLLDENIIISDTGIELDILGLSLAKSMKGDRYGITRWLIKSKDKFTILLGHAPDYVIDIRDKDIDLCLAGHTHGGQIRLPFIGPLMTASSVPREWAMGFRRIGQLYLNVSAGIGAERLEGLPAIRFNCPPDISIITVTGRTSPSSGGDASTR